MKAELIHTLLSATPYRSQTMNRWYPGPPFLVCALRSQSPEYPRRRVSSSYLETFSPIDRACPTKHLQIPSRPMCFCTGSNCEKRVIREGVIFISSS